MQVTNTSIYSKTHKYLLWYSNIVRLAHSNMYKFANTLLWMHMFSYGHMLMHSFTEPCTYIHSQELYHIFSHVHIHVKDMLTGLICTWIFTYTCKLSNLETFSIMHVCINIHLQKACTFALSNKYTHFHSPQDQNSITQE